MTRRSGFVGPRHAARRLGWVRATGLAVGTAMVAILCTGGLANGFWTTTISAGSAGGSTLATVGSVAAPAVSVAQNVLTPSWAAATLSGGRAVTGYKLTRYDSSGLPVVPSGGCSGAITGTTCTETSVPDGLWRYTVTPIFGANWKGAESAKSNSTISDATAPVNSLSLTGATGGGSFYRAGTPTLFYQGATAGSVRIVNAVTDAGTGPQSSSTGALPTDIGFTHSPSNVATPAGGPFVSNPISWTAGTTASQNMGITGFDGAGNQSDTVFALVDDDVAPSGGSISYTGGTSSTTSITLSLDPGTDSGSGLQIAVPARSQATLAGGTCGSFGGYSAVYGAPAGGGSFSDTGLTRGYCYRYRYIAYDNVGNYVTYLPTGSPVVQLPTYADTTRAAPGFNNYWRLDEASGTTARDTKNGSDASWFGGPALATSGALAGDSDTAVTFDGVDDYGIADRDIRGDFTIEFWFKSTNGRGTSSNWYDGAGMVDADVSGIDNDLGVTLRADGAVMAGTGNPDTTLVSPSGYADGVWHQVAFTRTRASGALSLYVDGALKASGTGGTTALNASAAGSTRVEVAFGRIYGGGGFFKGSLDEIAFSTAPQSASYIQGHYLQGRP